MLQLPPLAAALHHLVGDLLERVQAQAAAVLDDDLEAAGRAQAVHRRCLEDADRGVLDLVLELGQELRRQGAAVQVAAVLEIVQHDVHGAEIRGVGVEQQRLAGDGHRAAHALGVLGDLLDPVHDLARPADRGRVGELDVDEQIPLVLRGDEPRRRLGESPPRQDEQSAVADQHEGADPQEAADRARVSRGRRVKRLVEAVERRPQDAVEQRPGEPAADCQRARQARHDGDRPLRHVPVGGGGR